MKIERFDYKHRKEDEVYLYYKQYITEYVFYLKMINLLLNFDLTRLIY